MCGKNGKINFHHVIPKKFHPKENTLIPLCKDCHMAIHHSKILPSFNYEDTIYTGNSKNIPYIIMYIKLKKMERINKNLNTSNSFLVREINRIRKETKNGQKPASGKV